VSFQLPICCCFLWFDGQRYLHSFPTRRSSDLAKCITSRDNLECAKRCLRMIWRGGMQIGQKERLVRGFPAPTFRFQRHKDGINLDRKSTRLNSSHGSISYAVFCLKKTTSRESE